MKILIILLLFISSHHRDAKCVFEADLTFKELLCEYATNPLGLDTKTPRFSWILSSAHRGQMQTAFQVLVSSRIENLDINLGDKWDSGKTISDNSVNVRYEGNPLTSGEICYWKVRVWDKDSMESAWSPSARFEMGLLTDQDWQGKWIGSRIFHDQDYTSGIYGQAVILKGKDQPIKARYHRLAKLEDGITICAWIKPDQFADQWQTIYRKQDGDATQVLAIGKKSGIKGLWFGLGVNGVYEENGAPLPENFFENDSWHFVAATYDRLAKRIYLDGEEIKTFTNPGLIYPQGYATAYIGSRQNQKDFFKGGIDELKIFRNALAREQIQEVKENKVISKDLIGWWDFEETLDNKTTHRSNPPGEAQLLRKEFVLTKKVKHARVYFSGLGLSELYLNGFKVGEDVLSPAFTDYHQLVEYITYDITPSLRLGANALGIFLGNGWYSAKIQDYAQNWSDRPQLLLQLNIEFEDGSKQHIISDQSWKYSSAPIGENDIDFGEHYDARKEQPGWQSPGFDDRRWLQAEEKDGPTGKRASPLMPAIKIVETIKPYKMTHPAPGTYVYHFDQLFGGWAKIFVKGTRGDEVSIKYSSRLLKNGLVDEEAWPGEQQQDFYILKGDPQGESYEPRFTFHPVQYVQIQGCKSAPSLKDIEGRIVRTDEDLSGDFSCSNELFNKIHDNVNRTLSNSLKGFLLDCVGREPYGYNEPASIAASLFTRKAMPLFWTKFATDIRLAARADGSVGDVIPAFPGKPRAPDVSQGAAYAMLVWYLYQSYNDLRLVEEHYVTIRNWVDYITDHMCDEEIVTIGWLGDHMVPGKAPGYEKWRSDETPPGLSWTALYYRNVRIVAYMASVLGKTQDQIKYTLKAEKIKKAFNDKWLDVEKGSYASGSQTANLLPLSLDLVPANQIEKLVSNIANTITHIYQGHLRVGHAGITALIESLTAHGLGEVMYKIVNTTDYPGWGYMVDQGATTIWESWGRDFAAEGGRRRSDNMTMLAGVNEFFYQNIAGIHGPRFYGMENMKPGYQEIFIKPQPLGDLTFAKATVKTVRGDISSSWKKSDGTFTLDVEIPVNAEAYLSIPLLNKQHPRVLENNIPVWSQNHLLQSVSGVYEARISKDHLTLKVGSGRYSFQVLDL